MVGTHKQEADSGLSELEVYSGSRRQLYKAKSEPLKDSGTLPERGREWITSHAGLISNTPQSSIAQQSTLTICPVKKKYFCPFSIIRSP